MVKGLESAGGLHVSGEAVGGRAVCCVGKALFGLQNLGGLVSAWELFCACTGWLVGGFEPVSRYDLIPQMGGRFQYRISAVYTGGSVQHGLSATGGVYGFYEHYSATNKH
jgi:hypothetical protein